MCMSTMSTSCTRAQLPQGPSRLQDRRTNLTKSATRRSRTLLEIFVTSLHIRAETQTEPVSNAGQCLSLKSDSLSYGLLFELRQTGIFCVRSESHTTLSRLASGVGIHSVPVYNQIHARRGLFVA